jgi:NADH-quinone oxidoreductase subunit N
VNFDLYAILPVLILVLWGCVLLLLEALSRNAARAVAGPGTLALALVSGIGCICLWANPPGAQFGDMLQLDRFSLFFYALFALILAMTVLISGAYLRREESRHSEYYALLCFTVTGAMLMAGAGDMLVLFLGIELLSIPLYILAGFQRRKPESTEAALKYFLLGAFATGFLLYGIALVYGATGQLGLRAIADHLIRSGITSEEPILMIGLIFLVVAFGFKVSVVPFHMWTPDVYQGAPTSITAFMAAAPKAAGLAVVLRVFSTAFPTEQEFVSAMVVVLAVLTMTVGNLLALVQDNIKRMLAYSSIAHVGYLLVAVAASNELGMRSVLFYSVVYALMNIGAFGLVIMLGKKGESDLDMAAYAGAGFRFPLIGLAMTVFMFSLAGIPPTGGFFGKFYIFSAAVKAGYIWLAIIGVLNSALSLYFYLRVVVYTYMREPDSQDSVADTLTLSPGLITAVVIACLGTLYLGLQPGGLLGLTGEAIRALVG